MFDKDILYRCVLQGEVFFFQVNGQFCVEGFYLGGLLGVKECFKFQEDQVIFEIGEGKIRLCEIDEGRMRLCEICEGKIRL